MKIHNWTPALIMQELMAGKTNQSGDTSLIKPTGTWQFPLFDNLTKNGLINFQELLAARQQLIDNLPKGLQQSILRLITNEFQANQINDMGFRTLALASKTIAKEIQEISVVLQYNVEILPPEIQKEWVSISRPVKEQVLSTLTELSGSFLKTEKILDVPQTTGSFSFFLPLYFEEKGKPYPTYIHIYREQENENNANLSTEKELWLRICFLTENLGPIETVFCLRDHNLDIRIAGTEIQKALHTEDIRNSLKDLELLIGHIAVKSG